ncbi:hypothetical protein ACJMK2_041281 [Sinanodonta woodiana]|uniref:Transmembrane protein 69 n=1 Tax=Sinanodonta woodiana TaxID=1069815 RepID=A0ABD3W7E5_SINWO
MWKMFFSNKVPGFTLSQLKMPYSRTSPSSELFQSYLLRRGNSLMNSHSQNQRYYNGVFVRNKNCAALYMVDKNLCALPLWHMPRRYHTQEGKSKWKLILSEFMQIQHSPKPAVVYGLMGLIPFWGAPFLMVFAHAYLPLLVKFQFFYCALLLSFLGGARWGVAVTVGSELPPDLKNLRYTFVAPFIAWLSLLSSSPMSGYFMAMLGLTWAAYFDFTQPGYPPWFKSLRVALTGGAIISFLFTWVCYINLEPKHYTKRKISPQKWIS